jgi:hypothetical protein
MMFNVFRRKTRLTGYFDGVFDGRATGWTYDPSDPSRRLTVEIMHNGVVVACGLADLFREDLRATGVGDGRHAFSIPLGVVPLGSDVYQAREKSSGLLLRRSSPKPVGTGGRVAETIPDSEVRAQFLKSLAAGGGGASAIRQAGRRFEDSCRLMASGDLDGARRGFEALLSEFGEHSGVLCKVGEIAEAFGDLHGARQAFERAVRADVRFFWAHRGLAWVMLKLGNLQGALQAFFHASVLRPEDAAIQDRVGWLRAQVPNSESIVSGSVQAEFSRLLLESAMLEAEARQKARSGR